MAIQDKAHKLTVSDFLAIANQPASANRILELINGEITEKVPSFTPSRIASRISYFLTDFNMKQGETGYITGEAGGYVMNEGNVFNPDVAYIAKTRLPEIPLREAPVPPDLAVEIKSPTDSKRALRRKVEQYLDSGAALVWLVLPDEQLIEVYVPDQDVQAIGLDGTLDGGVVLPGLSIAVQQIFA
jgi:Uma2 family endonuclease